MWRRTIQIAVQHKPKWPRTRNLWSCWSEKVGGCLYLNWQISCCPPTLLRELQHIPECHKQKQHKLEYGLQNAPCSWCSPGDHSWPPTMQMFATARQNKTPIRGQNGQYIWFIAHPQRLDHLLSQAASQIALLTAKYCANWSERASSANYMHCNCFTGHQL